MSARDTRPRWLLRKQAQISTRRLSRFAKRVDDLDAATWWHQITQAAADLALEPGHPAEWSATLGPLVADDGGELI